jgi:uncharacterized UPF0160 family protein
MNKKTLVVHNGHFHSDDVFVVAALDLLFGKGLSVIRTRKPEVIETADIVADVGGIYDPAQDRFDHHQAGGAGKRDNGIPYASIGLVWKKYGADICGSEKVAAVIDEKLIQAIDAHDNGLELLTPVLPDVYPYMFDKAVRAFNLTWKESVEAEDDQFMAAVEIAKQILRREIIRTTDKLEAEALVEQAYNHGADPRLLVLDKPYPFDSIAEAHPELLYVVSPRLVNNTWNVSTVRKDEYVMANRKDFPQAWAGKRDQELAKVTGVSDAIFCHAGRFLAVAKSKAGALKLAELALGS